MQMSSTTKTTSASAFVDPQDPQEFLGDLELNENDPQLYSALLDNNHLSPFHPSHNTSNSASPSNNVNSTPGESYSEYSPYQPSDFSEFDQFLGVDFDAGVQRTDSLPSNLAGKVSYQSQNSDPHLPDVLAQLERKAPSDTLTASTYPLSPIHTSLANTPSPGAAVNDINAEATISQHELNNDLYKKPSQEPDTVAPTGQSALQLTPDQSGSSHTSAEGFKPGTMADLDRSPHVTVSQWEHGYGQNQGGPFVQPTAGYTNMEDIVPQALGQTNSPTSPFPVFREDDGSWRSNDRTGQAGLDPESRGLVSNEEMPTLGEQEEQRRILHKNIEVQEWRSQAGGSSEGEDEQPTQSYFPLNNPNWYQQSEPRAHQDPAEEDNDIAPVDDAASIRENKLVEGQVYYHPNNIDLTQADIELMGQPRQWYDPPSVPHITTTMFQPQTANDAIREFRFHADTISIASRAATWGTRRRSEPSLADFDAVSDGSFLKKLAINKPREGNRTRHNSIFDQGLDRLASIVRKRSDSRLKRAHSAQNIPDEAQSPVDTSYNNQGNLAPPPRTSSFGRRQTPTANTASAFAAMAGPLAAVGGTAHARNSSFSATPTSPKSPSHLGWPRSVIKRNRSKSELTLPPENPPQTSLVSLWRGHGGPPLPTLASPPVDAEVRQPEMRQAEVHDQDDDEDDEDEQGDDSDPKVESGEPIIPNYEGFKVHVRRLNPDMDSRYNWLVSRIAHQQEIRYKNLLDLRVKHFQAVGNRNCSAGRHCLALGGSTTLLDAKGNPREPDQSGLGLQLVTDFSDDDSNPGEGALTDDTFPQGVPVPPTRTLPAEFECQLCFKSKKFQKPSDWTKHVHEDVQPFTCTYDKCKEPKSFKRKADWVRHENERHRHLEWWICQVEDCKHPCYRKDNFLQHLVREHKLPEPKQKTKAAIKKARLTEPAWRMLEQCHHETQNRPQDEPCKFCGKSFATWKKLTVHLAKHMEHISLPVLKLVEARVVDATTIISPVEQIVTPITPITRAKMESSSPFNMDSVSPHMPMNPHLASSGFVQPVAFSTAGPTGNYGLQPAATSEAMYNQNNMYSNPNAFNMHHMNQPRVFGSLDASHLDHVNQGQAFSSADTGFMQSKMDQAPVYGSLDTDFPHQVPAQNYNPNHASGFSMNQDFTSAPPTVSQYPTTNVLGINNVEFAFDPMPDQRQSYPQVPMSRTPASNSSYGHPTPNIPFYSPQ
ncbi:C2H2 and C2HC zinc finger [Venustampulla echinocandica]|uniref:C2H2 and C2HC zinc finger n=1 Tax=Venustampulla echinocandica TaxID=2656787 RepID=A0A370TMM7_9HELO|nr:C2H2 and C2HC zinc finger [Venustampulla echinocandica]RDL36771.1 C2H2 and C2HC zinc finger [Venustampulla echinocandica]